MIKDSTLPLFGIITVLLIILTLNIFYTGLSYFTLIFYLLGALIYFLLIEIIKTEPYYNIDYIQTGNASLLTLIVFFVSVFLTANIYITFFLTVLIMILIEIFYSFITEFTIKEKFLYGISINLIAVFILRYIMFSGTKFEEKFLETIILGFSRTGENKIFLIAAFILLIIIFQFFFKRLSPELTAYSHGEVLSEISGINYKKIKWIATLTKPVLLTTSFFFLGWLGGIGVYIQKGTRARSILNDLKLLAGILLYTQLMIAISELVNYKFILILSVILSYIIFFIRQKVKNFSNIP